MIKKWGTFILIGIIIAIIYIACNNYTTIWDMILNIPKDVIVSYILGGLTMYVVIFRKNLHKKKHYYTEEDSES